MITINAPCQRVDRNTAIALDQADRLSDFARRFDLPAGLLYLDGNSLGALPRATGDRVRDVVATEWGQGLIRSWNQHDWIGAPLRIGTKIAGLIGADPGEVIVTDSTSANLFKLIVAAMRSQTGRRVILSEKGNFPTDLYMIQGAADLLGAEVRTVDRADIAAALSDEVGLLLLTHVHYKTAECFDMANLTRLAQAKGALVLWDLSHSAGAVELDLNGAHADLAVGCGYKYLNGGPGAPGYLFVARRHLAAMRSPLSGWMGHAAPFQFSDEYAPAEGIERFLCGTPPLLSLLALEVGVDLLREADMAALAAKSRAMGDYFIAAIEQECAGFGLQLASPRDAAQRGSHVSFSHPSAYAIMQALIGRGVIGDFRAPDMLRFGLTPLYLGFEQLWDAVAILRDILTSESWRAEADNGWARVT